MNKISKKIVSLVTMAAFALTLVPAAAFAAAPTTTGTTYSVDNSAAHELTITVNLDGDEYANTQLAFAFDGATKDNVDLHETATYYGDGGSQPVDTVVVTPKAEKVVATFTGLEAGETEVSVTMSPDGQGASWAAVQQPTTVTVKNDADRSKSVYGVFEGKVLQDTASVDVNDDLTTTFKINDINGKETADALDNVYVWAEDSRTNAPTSYISADKGTVEGDYYINLGSVKNNDTLDVQFTTGGTYTLYAGVGTDTDNIVRMIGETVVTVNDTTEVDSMTIEATWIDNNNGVVKNFDKGVFTFDKDAKTYTLDLTQVDGFNFNSIDKVVLKGTAYDGKEVALHQTINFAASEPNTVVRLTKTTDNTAYTGTFETAFTMESKKNTVITITEPESGVSYDVNVIAQKTSATDIDSVKDGGYVLATTDNHWRAAVNANLTGAVEFMVTDEKGDAVEGLTDKDFVLDVQGKPEKTSTLESSDLKVVEIGDGLYTLRVKATEVTADKNILTEGEYKVRVALAGVDSENDNIGVTFTAAEFGTIEDVELNIIDADTDVELDDQITLGTTANVSLVYVDGNGVKIAGPKTFSWNANNSALAVQSATGNTLVMKPNTIEHQGVIGSTVTVQAAVDGYGLVEKELTIVSTYNTYSMELDPAEGPVNEYNKVDLNVLNSDGDVAKNINGDINVVVADSSNEDAKVSVKESKAVKNGEGALTIYASQETELELVVTVVDNNNKIVAADTLTYTVGTADPLAGRTVVMTIDSTEYVVNNNIITGDAAPYVDSNWRTMVPIRALAESFDAEVYWNQDDSTVTIKFDAGTEIVMTVGEETYTVNGAEATMDTEPVNAGDRVYVPIRFAAEGLGFSVTPLYNDAGLTASVVFQR